jgi:hypothetical protein
MGAPPTNGPRQRRPDQCGAGFNQMAPGIVANLMRDENLTREQAAVLVGDLGYESGGFTTLQERGQTAGRGGYGWAQWTGSRRREFEGWAAANHLDPASSEANYGFLRHELEGPYAGFANRLRRPEASKNRAGSLILIMRRPLMC